MASEVISLLHGLLSSSASDTSKIWASAVRDVLCETLDNVPYLIETLEREGRISPRGDQTFNQETEHDEDEHLSNEHEWFFKARNVVASLCALGGFHKNVHSGCTVQVPQMVLLFRFIICIARASLGGLNIYYRPLASGKPQTAVTRLQFRVAEISNFSKAFSSVQFIFI